MAAYRHIHRQRRIEGRRNRRPRFFRDRSNPLEDLDEESIFQRFRFRRETILYILGLLPNMSSETNRNLPVPPVLQLLITLRYLATGAMHLLIADSVNVSRSTAGRCIRKVVGFLARLATDHVHFPRNEEAVKCKHDFYKIAGFPNVVGCVDGTLIRIRKPNENEQDYVNRKGYHSLNVQMCCDTRYRVTSLNASWPGSVHDSRIFRGSALCAQFEEGQHNGFLLGDSGYACRSFLLTPYLSPNTPGKEAFNSALCRTRVLIEQTFGILKRRFQILPHEMAVQPPQAVSNIAASVVLHNIGIERGDIIPFEEDVNVDLQNLQNVGADQLDGAAMRDHIMQTYFS